MTSGFEGATASAPTDDASFTESNTGYHVSPALVVFQTPPMGETAYKAPGWPITPDTADTRPARNGPRLRHERPGSMSVLTPWPAPHAERGEVGGTMRMMPRRFLVWGNVSLETGRERPESRFMPPILLLLMTQPR